MREAIMPRKMGQACGKIILSGNTANRFGKRALAVPVDMHLSAIWDKSDNTQEGLRIVWPGQKEDGVWLTTVRKITKLIEAQIGPVWGTFTIRNTLHLGKGIGKLYSNCRCARAVFFGRELQGGGARY